jgi:hypothetical protein
VIDASRCPVLADARDRRARLEQQRRVCVSPIVNPDLPKFRLLEDMKKARIVITNYHAFKRRDRMELSAGGRALLQGATGPELQTLETEGQMLQRVMPELMGMKPILATFAPAMRNERVGRSVRPRLFFACPSGRFVSSSGSAATKRTARATAAKARDAINGSGTPNRDVPPAHAESKRAGNAGWSNGEIQILGLGL